MCQYAPNLAMQMLLLCEAFLDPFLSFSITEENDKIALGGQTGLLYPGVNKFPTLIQGGKTSLHSPQLHTLEKG